jgi:hypothetical protein
VICEPQNVLGPFLLGAITAYVIGLIVYVEIRNLKNRR